ncbi:uncharacterized protein HaLaN_14077 [Haematococcus lacustris]|uniref:Uncharacterized protein n=1 Tax=Haematococcus lacustris TaxID=44745 RepID=A0A699ZDN6_HAELA|nr:hypothetical protein QJQ45_016212 [Haematococcus lacustris]GFH17439.1 uncharacterized protein HaLaN_14077 [Haematococcus lacustris]
MISLRADASSLEAKLQQVKLDNKGAPSKGPGSSSSAFSPQTGSLLSSVLAGDAREASMRQCFSAAFDAEVNYLTSLNIELTKDRRRQILADILVWAEVTQQHYDATTRSFVLEPNQHDESFLRIGSFLKDAMQEQGLL